MKKVPLSSLKNSSGSPETKTTSSATSSLAVQPLSTQSSLILGIDPGFDRLGWAVLRTAPNQKPQLLASGLISTDRQSSHYERYQTIDADLTQVIHLYQPTHAAMEKLFFQSNQKTVMTVSEARGVIMSSLFRAQLPLAEYTPPQIKLAITGYGRATKKAIEKLIRLQLNLPPQAKIIDDTLDAMAVALTHASTVSF